MDKLTKHIKTLNSTYKKFNSSIEVFEKFNHLNKDLDTYLYRIKKGYEEFNKCLLKELHKEDTNEQFNKIIKTLEDK